MYYGLTIISFEVTLLTLFFGMPPNACTENLSNNVTCFLLYKMCSIFGNQDNDGRKHPIVRPRMIDRGRAQAGARLRVG